MLFDSHAHYDDARFDPDRDALLSSMPQRGVSRILCVAADLDSADKCLALAERYPFVYAAAGVHPHEAKSFAPDQSDRLRAQLAHPKCVALGEIGLDYALDLSPRDLQRAVFSYQLRLAKVLDKPVIIHDREAHADTLALLKDAGCRGVVHCYSGSVEMARELVGMGFYLSFTGVITFANARKSHEVLRAVPRDRLMIETDAPYLTPVPHRGKRNDSSYVRYTCETMAQVLGLSFEQTAHLTYENACRCFSIDPQ
ncbi:MAG TPA: TatD family hydrolase [Candidatus Galloscillospira excrementipullorum]|nr:TatD family hydrolase [Candidatus Galloscillospira excrementipullorum]